MSEYSNHLFTPGTKNNSWAHLYDYIEDGSRVLDVGCSSGNFGESLEKLKKCEVIGIDLDENDVNEASDKLTSSIVMDINEVESYEKLGKFDAIIFADVIEHLVNPRKTLMSVKKLLKTNGIVAFSIPNMAHLSVRLQLIAGVFPYEEIGLLDNTHLHFYDRNEMESVFRDAGYVIQTLHPTIVSYPKEMIDKKLNKIGLVAKKAFYELLEATEADIFQFVGFAKPGLKTKTRHEKVLYVMPQDEVRAYAEEILIENKKLWTEKESIKLENEDLHQNLENIKHKPLKYVAKYIIKKTKLWTKRAK